MAPKDGEGLWTLGAASALERMAKGQLSARALVEALLARIESEEPRVQAWTALDPDYALRQADAVDALRKSGQPIGPLHGLPVGVKDIVDTKDLPTECGIAAYAGRRPSHDAALVDRLRAAGAIVLGKTVTTEHALFTPNKTRNPHDAARTPGGSSSGSAAAVASGMVPVAIGSQTSGSVIRPASFCGVVGFKPSHGSISRRGVLAISRHLDTMGTFGRSLEDAALLAEALYGYDPGDPDTRPAAHPRLSRTLEEAAPVPPLFALLEQPGWEQAEEAATAGLAELADLLGAQCDSLALPDPLRRGREVQETIMYAEMARSASALYGRSAESLSDQLRQGIETGLAILAHDYLVALDWQNLIRAGLEEVFERYDAIVTLPALGQAPSLETTGDSLFCLLWTLYGGPAVTLPVMQGEDGLPIGVQLIGRIGEDARLLRTAHWLLQRLQEEDQHV